LQYFQAFPKEAVSKGYPERCFLRIIVFSSVILNEVKNPVFSSSTIIDLFERRYVTSLDSSPDFVGLRMTRKTEGIAPKNDSVFAFETTSYKSLPIPRRKIKKPSDEIPEGLAIQSLLRRGIRRSARTLKP
jgi:hypothetical protein